MNELARLQTHERRGVTVAVLTGEIDISNAADLEQRLAPAGTEGRLVVDLTTVTFLDSAGVRLLDHLAARCGNGATFRVVAPSAGPVPFTLRICGFRAELVTDDVAAAVADLCPG